MYPLITQQQAGNEPQNLLEPNLASSSQVVYTMRALTGSQSFTSAFYEHLEAHCHGLLGVAHNMAPSPSGLHNGLPEINLERVQYCYDHKDVLGHNSTTDIRHVKIDGFYDAAFKLQSIQTLYIWFFKPHRRIRGNAVRQPTVS